MFVSQAHSFTSQARLAITLAWVGGYTNILTLITCGTVTSHVSGTASTLGLDVARGAWGPAGFALFLLAAFYFGAALSGFCTELGRRRGWESIYILPVAIEGGLLVAFGVGVELKAGGLQDWTTGLYAMVGTAAMAMGLQNATITRISSGVVRTTHVTGVLTDLGIESARFAFFAWDKRSSAAGAGLKWLIRRMRQHPDALRMLLLGSIFGSFVFGAAFGAAFQAIWPRVAMLPPILFLGYIIIQDRLSPIAEIRPMDPGHSGKAGAIPSNLAVYHMRKPRSRDGVRHRMPNLTGWAGRLPARTDQVILDLGREARLDSNAVMELRAVSDMLRSQGRRLILAGLTAEQREQLKRGGRDGPGWLEIHGDVAEALSHAATHAQDAGMTRTGPEHSRS